MRRFTAALAVVVLLGAVPFSHLALAQPGPPMKVAICHIFDIRPVDPDDPEGPQEFVGEVLSVAEPALKAHCGHGDHDDPLPEDEDGNPMIGAECTRPADAAEGDFTCNGENATTPNLDDEEEEEEEEEG